MNDREHHTQIRGRLCPYCGHRMTQHAEVRDAQGGYRHCKARMGTLGPVCDCYVEFELA